MADQQYVDLYLTCPDIEFSHSYHLPRMTGIRPLLLALQANLDAAYPGMRAEYKQYGKPSRLTFEYTEGVLREHAFGLGVDITEIYMIGDNPSGDIAGANRMGKGWNSILVQSGIYKPGTHLEGDHKPTYEVEDI